MDRKYFETTAEDFMNANYSYDGVYPKEINACTDLLIQVYNEAIEDAALQVEGIIGCREIRALKVKE